MAMSPSVSPSPKVMLVVSGPASCGKSTAIKLAFESLLRRATIVAFSRSLPPVRADFLYFTDREVAAAVHWTPKIGIATRGDSAAEVSRSLGFLLSSGCNIIVCATRSKGGPSIAALSFASTHGYFVTSHTKKPAPGSLVSMSRVNAADAKFIRKWVRRYAGI
jgi:hypothetical protein